LEKRGINFVKLLIDHKRVGGDAWFISQSEVQGCNLVGQPNVILVREENAIADALADCALKVPNVADTNIVAENANALIAALSDYGKRPVS